MKKCYLCKSVKLKTEFYRDSSRKDGLANRCKPCDSAARKERISRNFAQKAEYDRKRREADPEAYAAYQAEYRKRNAEQIGVQRAEYRKRNSEKIAKANKAWIEKNYSSWRSRQREYYRANREWIVKRNSKYRSKRRKTNNLVAIADRVRRRLANAIARQGYTKRSSTNELIGCDWNTLASHLESQFTDGMTWENRGEWHIDHIIPLASASTEEELLALCHYTNLQPLWAFDNLSKGAKMPENTI